jgi:acetyl-CoA carboxylase carboxyl transferase subunit beta
MATWGAMGHLTFAQPGSLLGLVGPRALSGGSGATNGQERVAEEWACHGLIDGVVAPRELRAVLGRALTILYGRAAGTDDSAANTAASAMLAGIGRVQQGPEQTLGASVLELVSESALPLAWGRSQCRATAVLCRLGHVPCVLISTVWTVQQDGQLCGSEELRLFRRAIRLADDLHLPVVSLVESAGPDASPESDLAGVCQEIARCTAELLQLPTPTVSVITGVAVGGPAIAMLPADRVLCTSHAWLSPMSPQGIARIVGASSRGRPEPVTGAGPEGLRALGIVDREIPTPAGASRQAVAAEVVLAVEQELRELMQTQTQRRLAQRTQRYLSLGSL